jgi:acyl dehydratase
MTSPEPYSVATLSTLEGHDFGKSAPVVLNQARIDAFAECTEDRQWIHVDPERAASESPFGGTIAHGMLTLSLIAGKHLELGVYPSDARQVINYGMESVRFLAPVPEGATVRVQVRIKSVQAKGEGRFVVRTENEVRVDGAEKPALIAELIAYVMA